MEVNVAIRPVAKVWKSFRDVAGVGHIASDADYERVVELTDRLVEAGASAADHELHGLFMMLADILESYEARRYPAPAVTGTELLRFLMSQHSLRQVDLIPEFGSQGVVSEVLSGKRDLSKAQIAALAKRFSLSPAAFF